MATISTDDLARIAMDVGIEGEVHCELVIRVYEGALYHGGRLDLSRIPDGVDMEAVLRRFVKAVADEMRGRAEAPAARSEA